MPKTVPNANKSGPGGPVAALARGFAESSIVRMAKVLTGEQVVDLADIVVAARTVLRGGKYVDRETKMRALRVLNRLVEEPKTPDKVAVKAAALILEATGRKPFRPSNQKEN